MLRNRRTKAQSAMEYLMTYGWAILIIAVVLGALFSLGVFSGSSLLGTSCVASPGYLCSTPILATTGQLSINFGQNTGSTIYNVELACTSTTNSLGLPANQYAFVAIYSGSGNTIPTGQVAGNAVQANAVNIANAVSLASGQTIAVSYLPCYGTTGLALGGSVTPGFVPSASAAPAIGTTFSGFILLNYTTSACTTGTGCTWYTVRAATVTVKVV